MKTNKLQLLLAVGISLLVGYYLGVNQINLSWQHYQPSLTVTSKEPPAGANIDYSLFWIVYDKLNKEYYDKKVIDPKKELYGAIGGMVQSLNDPYTMFLPP